MNGCCFTRPDQFLPYAVAGSGKRSLPNTKIDKDLVEEVVDEGFTEDAAEVFEGAIEVDGDQVFGPAFLQGLRNALAGGVSDFCESS